METLFFELLQVAIGNRQQLSAIPTKEEWLLLYEIAKKQSLLGIAFSGMEKLPKEQWPERQQILRWTANAAKIKQRNILTSEVCLQLCEEFSTAGFRTCILKGQANHVYYDEHLKNVRTCGDVDIWIVPEDNSCEHPVKKVLTYMYSQDAVKSLCYLHVEMPPVKTVPVEVHLRPSFMNSPVKNHRFQNLYGHGTEKFDECVCLKEIEGQICLPALKTEYDMIFQMNHIYRHLIDEGVGLRQVLDYYMLLKEWHQIKENSTLNIQCEIKRLGMNRFSGALMYVLQEVFAMPTAWLICEASEKDGRFLLDEIMRAGNFGHYDGRMVKLEMKKGQTSYQVRKAWRRFCRNLRFFASYPEEVFWEPFARIGHLWWRKYKWWNL